MSPSTSSNQPIRKQEEVASNPDPKIDQDYNNFPHEQSSPDLINPKTEAEKKTAQVTDIDDLPGNSQKGDGGEAAASHLQERAGSEVSRKAAAREGNIEEIESDGSANAFERTEGDQAKVIDEQKKKGSSYY